MKSRPLLLLVPLLLLRALAAGEAADPAGSKVGWLWDERYKTHKTPAGHPERKERLDAVRAGVEASAAKDLLVKVAPAPVEDRWLAAVHDADYLASLNRDDAGGDLETAVSPGSVEIAKLAVGGVLAACDGVMAGDYQRAFCAVRPPGHHATRNRAMGFCIYGNVAVAANYLLEHHGLERVLVVDWDVHHGNGTYDLLKEDPRVFQFHLQQFPHYPGTGHPNETGEGEAKGKTRNVIWPRDAGIEEYRKAFREQLVPAMADFKPQFILVSCGFDSHAGDPLGGFKLTAAGYRELTAILCAIADAHGEGRIVSVLEGGYSLENLTAAAAAHVEALAGLPAPAAE